MDLSRLKFQGKWFTFHFDSAIDIGELKLKLKPFDPFAYNVSEIATPELSLKIIADSIVDWNIEEDGVRIEPTHEKKIEVIKIFSFFKIKDKDVNFLTEVLGIITKPENFFEIS